MLGLSGQDPEYIPVENIDAIINWNKNEINLGNEKLVPFISSKTSFSIKLPSFSCQWNDFYGVYDRW
jgi:hypothetical protein